MCRATALDRAIRSSAFLLQKYVDDQMPTYEVFRLNHPELIVKAFQYADAMLEDRKAEEWRKALWQVESDQIRGVPESDSKVVQFVPLHQAIIDLTLAALVGHEIAHTKNGLCPVQEISRAEESGLWKKLIKDEQTGEIFTSAAPNLDELQADQCGLRYVRRALDRLFTRVANASRREFAQRIAADMVAFEIQMGWRKFVVNEKYVVLWQPGGYLYPPYRATAFASEAHGGPTPPAVCGYAAELIVMGVQSAVKKYPDGRGNVDDDFLALFPKGVETSWNGAKWTPLSFTCAPAARRGPP